MQAWKRLRTGRRRWIVAVALSLAGLAWIPPATARPPAGRPNILFFVLDDVGMDQMKVFGFGGATAPRTPNIDAIASAGVAFRNFWSMPECSPSRALMFEGRYPLRTHVTDAILSVDLANSQVSPYETTTPKVLRGHGYESGLFGKFHLTGSDINPANNPLGYTGVHQLGWDYFAGWQDGAPHPIDTTAGGVAAANVSYPCGFVPNAKDDPINGADAGACYFVDQSCVQIALGAQSPTPGRTCLQRGGIFVPGATCSLTAPAGVNFTLQNGYYAGQLVVNRPDGSYTVTAPQDPSGAARGYRSVIESDRAIDWIRTRPYRTPWMATVSYSSAHTPYQQPPTSLLPPASQPTGRFDCLASEADQRVLSNQMIEAMDAEIGRVLLETGIATRGRTGKLQLLVEYSDTMIVIMGDNGTYAPGVKAPFNPLRAKATVYQTGVWTPLIVAGPLVKSPGREVGAMVNIADVFQLFAEIAGIDVHKVVPSSRPLDSVSMLPYLANPDQKSLRQTSFTQTAGNIKAAGYVVPPCVIPGVNTCVQLFPSQSLCASEGGVWWGAPDATVNPPRPVAAGAPQPDCCSVNKYNLAQSPPQGAYSVLPDWQMAMRDDDYKLVRQSITNYDTTTDKCVTADTTEFYAIDQSVPPKLDDAEFNLLAPPHALDHAEQAAFAKLTSALATLLDSEVPCTGDGNLDGVVNQADIDQFNYWASATGSNSSWYDFNLDGLTNSNDVPYITQGGFPRRCPAAN